MESIRTAGSAGIIRYRNEKGDLHREDGPAIVFFDGTEWYYLNQKRYSKEDWEEEVVKLKLKRLIEL
jgi:hypothetical protein